MYGVATAATSPLRFSCNADKVNKLSLQELPPNALLRKRNSSWRGGFSLGVDLGMSRTGLALSKGFSIRPLKVFDEITRCNSCLYLLLCHGLLYICY